jgi:hypothetical protein
MLEFARNEPLDGGVLADLFARCGWEEAEAGVKLGWALAASAEWVVCKVDGQLVGFGRSCRLGPVKRVVFDLMVDPRFDHPVVRVQILRMLSQSAGGLEEVSVFRGRRAWSAGGAVSQPAPGDVPQPAEAGVPQSVAAGSTSAGQAPAGQTDDGQDDEQAQTQEGDSGEVYIGGGIFNIPPAPPDAYLGRHAKIEEEIDG